MRWDGASRWEIFVSHDEVAGAPVPPINFDDEARSADRDPAQPSLTLVDGKNHRRGCTAAAGVAEGVAIGRGVGAQAPRARSAANLRAARNSGSGCIDSPCNGGCGVGADDPYQLHQR